MGENSERTYTSPEVARAIRIYAEIEERRREVSCASNEAFRGRCWEGLDKIERFIDNIKMEISELGHFTLTDKLKELEDEFRAYLQIKPELQDELYLNPVIDNNVFSLPFYRNNGFSKKR